MLDVGHIRMADYDYALPEERIAKYPLPRRDQSKLLVRHSDGTIEEKHFYDLPDLLPQGRLMVMNNTRVIRARLHFQKETGATVEIFLLEPAHPADYQLNLGQKRSVTWFTLIGHLKRWKTGLLCQEIEIDGVRTHLTAEKVGLHGNSHEVRFSWDNDLSFSEILEAIGELPIPPYLNRATEESDLQTYQTVYAKVKGSVAAPTAGLHFTPELLSHLDAKGIERQEVTLHVGAGTFRPVKSEEIGDHDMHAEWISVERKTVERLIAHEGHCIAVGTTSVRTLESLYFIGCQILNGKDNEIFHVDQWEPYDENRQHISTLDALNAVWKWYDRHNTTVLHADTQIIIVPGYDYRIVDTLITNFHQPQSTLLLLVSAFVDGKWREMYDFAMKNGFRFLSYGDGNVVFREQIINKKNNKS